MPIGATTTDRQQAQAALDKLRRGDTPTKSERRALDRVKSAQQEELTDKILRAVPKRIYCKMADRQVRTLNEQAARYNLPCDGPEVNLFAVIRWLHDMLATHGNKLIAGPDEDPLLAGANSPMLEKCRKEKWMLLQMERREKEQSLVDRSLLRECHQRIGAILKKCGETIERQFGIEPAELLREALDDCWDQINTLLTRRDHDKYGDKQTENETGSAHQHSIVGGGQLEPEKDDGGAG